MFTNVWNFIGTIFKSTAVKVIIYILIGMVIMAILGFLLINSWCDYSLDIVKDTINGK